MKKEDIGHISDSDVIKKILGGEVYLFELLVRKYNSVLYKVGRSYNFNHEDTQDLMQQSYIDAYVNLPKFENRSSFKTWITRLMLNNCFRKKQKLSFKNEIAREIDERAVPIFANTNRYDTGAIIMNKELSNILESALLKVPIDYRIVFSLREINGMSVSEAAEIMKISEANVKTRLNRAKSMLRKEIEKNLRAEEIFEFNLIYCDTMVTNVMTRIYEINSSV